MPVAFDLMSILAPLFKLVNVCDQTRHVSSEEMILTSTCIYSQFRGTTPLCDHRSAAIGFHQSCPFVETIDLMGFIRCCSMPRADRTTRQPHAKPAAIFGRQPYLRSTATNVAQRPPMARCDPTAANHFFARRHAPLNDAPTSARRYS
jgi:hypothetical protein